MSLYGPTFHVTPVDLCIIFQCNLYISCIMHMSCRNKIVLNCFKLFQLLCVAVVIVFLAVVIVLCSSCIAACSNCIVVCSS